VSGPTILTTVAGDGLTGRRVVVTGASRGIGAAVVRRMTAAGADVACCARDSTALLALADEVAGAAGSVYPRQADLTNWAELDAFIDEARAVLGGIDVLVNNAGQVQLRNFMETDESAWEHTLRVNLLSAVRSARRVLPGMVGQRWGRIVMVASSGAKYPEAAWIDYAASKAGLVTTAKALAREFAAANVLINAVLPGVIDTPMWDGSAHDLAERQGVTPADVKAAVLRTLPMGRFGTVAEVADLIAFMASDRANYLSGAAIDLDGALATHVF
jgi:NAD(P)-dependent dehydrogenase (short-subunit alcohol dehydrogenase family)